jgi:hypothetical protein
LSVGTFLGEIPAIIVALIFESPNIAVLTVVAYVLIQHLEGNFLAPRGGLRLRSGDKALPELKSVGRPPRERGDVR